MFRPNKAIVAFAVQERDVLSARDDGLYGQTDYLSKGIAIINISFVYELSKYIYQNEFNRINIKISYHFSIVN